MKGFGMEPSNVGRESANRANGGFGRQFIGLLLLATSSLGTSQLSGAGSALTDHEGSFPSLRQSKILPKAFGLCERPQCLLAANDLIRAMDETADPCEDFFQFACGGWYASHPVTNVSAGTFEDAQAYVTKSLNEIFNSSAASSDPQPLKDIRTHYSTCMDTDTMDKVGIDPLWAQLTSQGQGGWPIVMDSWDENAFTLEEALVNVEKIEVNPIIALGIAANFLNTSYNIIYITEGSLGLSSTYLLDPENSQEQISYYKSYIAETAKLIRDSIGSSVSDREIDTEAQTIIDFEIALANTMQFLPELPHDIFEKVDVAYLQSATDSGVVDQFNWLNYFDTLFEGTTVNIDSTEPIYLSGEPFLPALSTLLAKTDRRTLANYIGWWWVMTTGDATTYAMRNASLAYQNAMFGTTSLYSPRSDHCRVQTQLNLAMPTSRAYVDGYFPQAAKPEVTQMVAYIRDAFSSLLQENTWMTPDDIVDAEEKLAAIVDRVAYPDWIMNNLELTAAFHGLSIVAGQQYDNLIRMADYFNFWTLESFRMEPRSGWLLPPTIVNAYYDVFSNSISILAAILQSPFFKHNSLAALNFGGIGTVIGHEFTHGFDNTGRHFDKNGNLANWWDRESKRNFRERSQCFVEQYDQYYPPELQGTPYSNMSVNGQQTLGENIADNGGIREAFRAYMSYIADNGEEPRLPGLQKYSPDQLFFIGYANVWCEHETTEDTVDQLENNVHSPGRFRVIGALSNDEDFRNTWSCSATSAMNRGNESCILWPIYPKNPLVNK